MHGGVAGWALQEERYWLRTARREIPEKIKTARACGVHFSMVQL
jgi:hypothetical protein